MADFRWQSLREELVARQTNARQALQEPWLQSAEKELHKTTTKLLSAGVNRQTRTSLEAYQVFLQDKLKHNQESWLQSWLYDCLGREKESLRHYWTLEHRTPRPGHHHCPTLLTVKNSPSRQKWPMRMQCHLQWIKTRAVTSLTFSSHNCQPHQSQLCRSETRLQYGSILNL